MVEYLYKWQDSLNEIHVYIVIGLVVRKLDDQLLEVLSCMVVFDCTHWSRF